MNNTINRIKKRADTLADFIINKVERLEAENHELYKHLDQSNFKLHTHELVFEKVLDDIIKTEKTTNGDTILITFRGKDNNGDTDTLYAYFHKDEPLYPLAEMLLEKYEKKKEFGKLIKKGFISHIEPL